VFDESRKRAHLVMLGWRLGIKHHGGRRNMEEGEIWPFDDDAIVHDKRARTFTKSRCHGSASPNMGTFSFLAIATTRDSRHT